MLPSGVWRQSKGGGRNIAWRATESARFESKPDRESDAGKIIEIEVDLVNAGRDIIPQPLGAVENGQPPVGSTSIGGQFHEAVIDASGTVGWNVLRLRRSTIQPIL